MRRHHLAAVIGLVLAGAPVCASAATPAASAATPSAATPTAATGAMATSTVVVRPDARQGWVSQALDGSGPLPSTQEFVSGPATPPLGVGSLRLPASAVGYTTEMVHTDRYDGRYLRDLRDLGYSTYEVGTDSLPWYQQQIFLSLYVDRTGDGVSDDNLYFVPANNGTLAQGTWQTWDAETGTFSVNALGMAGPTLADYLATYPDARLVSADIPGGHVGSLVFITLGSMAASGGHYLDNVSVGFAEPSGGSTVNTTVFDFEPASAPPPAFMWRVSDARVTERDPGARVNLVFNVTISKPRAQPVMVNYSTFNGTARAGSDYAARTGRVTVPAGATRVRVTIPVLSDQVREATENMRIVLNRPSAGGLADPVGIGTIVDDD